MIHPRTEIQWMDVKREKVWIDKAINLYIGFSDRIVDVVDPDADIKEISFKPGEVKITDWRGWTDIRSIRRVKRNNIQWVYVCLSNQGVVVSSDEKLPIYTSEVPRKGFHGASVFPFTLKEPREITEGDLVRFRRGMSPEGEQIEFYNPLIIPLYDAEEKYGYEIITSSKFYNAANIHLFASKDIPSKMEVSR